MRALLLGTRPGESQHLGRVNRCRESPELIGERHPPGCVCDRTAVLVVNPLDDADDVGRIVDIGARAQERCLGL